MRLGPATQAALLSRMLLTAVFSPQAPKHPGKVHCASALKRAPRCNANLRLTPQFANSAVPILPWKGRISEEAAMPGHLIHWTESDLPRRLTLERITGNAEPWSATLQKHLAL